VLKNNHGPLQRQYQGLTKRKLAIKNMITGEGSFEEKASFAQQDCSCNRLETFHQSEAIISGQRTFL